MPWRINVVFVRKLTLVEMFMVVLDTNIVILYLEKETKITDWVDRCLAKNEQFAISSMTVVELLGYQEISIEEIFRIERWLHGVLVIDVDINIAREAARLRRGKQLTTTDAVIVATAAALNASLVTRDARLSKVRGIKVIRP
ncbi:MAG: PIN domain-containing protein [Patescibacteria group bacterium]